MRQESARAAVDDCVLLSILYSEHDRIMRQHLDRQSRVTITLFRQLPLVSKFRMRQLHRLGKSVTHKKYGENSVVNPSKHGSNEIYFLASGSVAVTKTVSLITHHRLPTSARVWEMDEHYHSKSVAITQYEAPCILSHESLLGCQFPDYQIRTLTVCEIYVLPRQQFHFLLQPSTLGAITSIVDTMRKTIENAVESEIAMEEEQSTKVPRRMVKLLRTVKPNDGNLRGNVVPHVTRQRYSSTINSALPVVTDTPASSENPLGGERGERPMHELLSTLHVQVKFSDFLT